jgi:hypothetical protein
MQGYISCKTFIAEKGMVAQGKDLILRGMGIAPSQ